MHQTAPRSKPKSSFPRKHYNSKKKSKKQFDSEDDAKQFIKAKHLDGYSVYYCDICSHYHISHLNDEE